MHCTHKCALLNLTICINNYVTGAWGPWHLQKCQIQVLRMLPPAVLRLHGAQTEVKCVGRVCLPCCGHVPAVTDMNRSSANSGC
jgi:hypothetical protein